MGAQPLPGPAHVCTSMIPRRAAWADRPRGARSPPTAQTPPQTGQAAPRPVEHTRVEGFIGHLESGRAVDLHAEAAAAWSPSVHAAVSATLDRRARQYVASPPCTRVKRTTTPRPRAAGAGSDRPGCGSATASGFVGPVQPRHADARRSQIPGGRQRVRCPPGAASAPTRSAPPSGPSPGPVSANGSGVASQPHPHIVKPCAPAGHAQADPPRPRSDSSAATSSSAIQRRDRPAARDAPGTAHAAVARRIHLGARQQLTPEGNRRTSSRWPCGDAARRPSGRPAQLIISSACRCARFRRSPPEPDRRSELISSRSRSPPARSPVRSPRPGRRRGWRPARAHPRPGRASRRRRGSPTGWPGPRRA